MLSVFPSLLSWSGFSPLILRVALAAVLIYWAYAMLKSGKSAHSTTLSPGQERAIAAVECIAGVLLIIGLWTQVAALLVAIDLAARIVSKIRQKTFLTNGVNYYLILLVIAVSLMLSGPGIWSIDLPL